MKVMWLPENCKQSSRVCFHLHHANFWKYFSTLILDHGPLNPALQGPVSLCSSKWSWRLSPKTRHQVSFMQQKAHRPTCQVFLSPPHYYISLTQGRSMETEFINLTSCNIPHSTPIYLQAPAWSLVPPPLGIQTVGAAETYRAPSESGLCTIATSLGCSSPACKGHRVMNSRLTSFSNQNFDLISGPAWLTYMVFLFL